MTIKVKNTKTGKFVKNAIDGKEVEFTSKEHAQKWADGMTRNSVLSATAFNSIRPCKYIVVEI